MLNNLIQSLFSMKLTDREKSDLFGFWSMIVSSVAIVIISTGIYLIQGAQNIAVVVGCAIVKIGYILLHSSLMLMIVTIEFGSRIVHLINIWDFVYVAIASALPSLIFIHWLFLIRIGPLLAIFLSFTRIVIGIRFGALCVSIMMILTVNVLNLIPTSFFAFFAMSALWFRILLLLLLRVMSVVVSITVSILLIG